MSDFKQILASETDASNHCAVCGNYIVHNEKCATYLRKLKESQMDKGIISSIQLSSALNSAIQPRTTLEFLPKRNTPFTTPYEHLNFLNKVIGDDFAEVHNTEGRATDEVLIFNIETNTRHLSGFDVLEFLWVEIESLAQRYQYDIFNALHTSYALRDIRHFRQRLMRLEGRSRFIDIPNVHSSHLIEEIARAYEQDYSYLIKRDQEYHASWLKRGGVGAFMTFCRKWDRFAPMVCEYNRNALDMLAAHPDRIDDVQDLRRYLLLVESEWMRQNDIHHVRAILEGGE